MLASLLGLFYAMHHVSGEFWRAFLKKNNSFKCHEPFGCGPRSVSTKCSSQCGKHLTNAIHHDNKSSLSAALMRQKKNCPIRPWHLRCLIFRPTMRELSVFTPLALCSFCGFCGGQRKCRTRAATTTACRTSHPHCLSLRLSLCSGGKEFKKKLGLPVSQMTQWRYCIQTCMQITLTPLTTSLVATGHCTPPSTVLLKPDGWIWENVDATLNVYPEHVCFFVISKSWI